MNYPTAIRTYLLVTIISLCNLNITPTQAADTAPKSDGFKPMLNGKDLTGWVPVNTAPSTWAMVDGMLHCTGKPIGELRTARMYQNFIMEVEWRHMKKGGNAGIFVWADDITARGQPFHRGIEVQILDHGYGNGKGHTTHGDIFPIHGARMKPINGRGGSRAFPKELRGNPSPKWNHYRIECNQGNISLAVNGKVVTQGTKCSPSKGYICLESEGGIVDYRNMRIKVLPDTPVDAKDIAIANRGYKTLYTGVDLSGWTVAKDNSKHWKSHGWTFSYNGKSNAKDKSITTTKSFGDIGFVFDVSRPANDSDTRILLRGSDKAAIHLSPSNPTYGKLISKGKGWMRIEGTIKGKKLSFTINGKQAVKDYVVAGLPATGPIKIVPTGVVKLANVFARTLK
jgi:hypothetical protein